MLIARTYILFTQNVFGTLSVSLQKILLILQVLVILLLLFILFFYREHEIQVNTLFLKINTIFLIFIRKAVDRYNLVQPDMCTTPDLNIFVSHLNVKKKKERFILSTSAHHQTKCMLIKPG